MASIPLYTKGPSQYHLDIKFEVFDPLPAPRGQAWTFHSLLPPPYIHVDFREKNYPKWPFGNNEYYYF